MAAEVKASKPSQRPVEKAGKFVREVRAELKKTSWPDRKELITSTGVVLGTVLVISAFIGLVDIVFAEALTVVIK